MSRSYRKTPIFGNAHAASEKRDKQQAHQVERTQVRTMLSQANAEEGVEIPASKHAYSNRYSHAKDGKRYQPVLVRIAGRAMQALSLPSWVRGERQAHKVMGK